MNHFSGKPDFRFLLFVGLLFAVTGPFLSAQDTRIDVLQRGFAHPPENAKIMMRWWWFGPAVTKPELEREMRLMKEGGIGGFEVQPTYPLLPDDPALGVKNLPFLSDEFLDALRFTSDKATELGLRMDLTLGSGWPFGGAQVPVNDAAGMLRTERVKPLAGIRRIPVPNITAGEKFIAVFEAPAKGQPGTSANWHEVKDIRDGAVWLSTEPGDTQEIVFFISSHTGMQVKRPAFGAEGYVLDHLSRPAAEHYLSNVGDRLMKAFGTDRPHSIFCDSLEVYGQDWTDDLLTEFQRRRGYDLRPHLPALVADIGPETEGVRHDWGRTLTELLNERFLSTVHDWSKKNRTLFRIQNYGVPGAAISSNAFEDLPEGEGPQWKVLRAARWASSASHIYGHPITSSETWTWLHSPVFRASPLDMKAEADLHFLEGINQLIGHGWPYTAPGVEYPGWRFYASAVFDEKNPWWIVMPDIAQYLQRVSFLMRQGAPANDVALYLSNSDAWSNFAAGRTHMIETQRELTGPDVIPAILEGGYNLDFFDDEILKQLGSVEKGALRLGPNGYRVVILPGVEKIPLGTLRKLDEFVRNGGILIATRRLPGVAPGLMATEAEQREVKEIIHRLFEGPGARAHFVKDERGQLAGTLAGLLRPDVSLDPSVPEIGFVHKKTSDADIYFVANTSNVKRDVRASFRVEGLRSELWNPMTGSVSPIETVPGNDGSTRVALSIEPYGSRVLVFSKRILRSTETRVTQALPPSIDLSRDWRVTFGPNGKSETFDRLSSWTEQDATRYFSGTAVYEKDVNIQPGLLRDQFSVQLDFGEGKPLPVQTLKAGMQVWLDAPVKEAAVIFVNGQKAGSAWCPPYRVDITGFLKPGVNKLRIVVANLALNYMAGQRMPDYRLLNLRFGERFQVQDMDKIRSEPSGLLGPIRLVWENR